MYVAKTKALISCTVYAKAGFLMTRLIKSTEYDNHFAEKGTVLIY